MRYLITLPYIYPVCPLNINHAKMFIVADIMARYARKCGQFVYFPIAAHYSGNTAQKLGEVFATVYSGQGQKTDARERNVLELYRNIYRTPDYVLKTFQDPISILNYYSQEIIWELRSLNVSCDYQYYYTTSLNEFSIFIRSVLSQYETRNVLVTNQLGRLALDYDNREWRDRATAVLMESKFIQEFHKNSVLSAFESVRNDWSLTRTNGLGTVYRDKWIIDPMFDSELFTVFDLFMRFRGKESKSMTELPHFFEKLFSALKNQGEDKDPLINEILAWLPCDVMVCEEHLKTWIVKRLYAESLLLNEQNRTKQYFILGMGLLDGQRMSASQGHAILAKDLIEAYGPTRARLIILLTGGHPSKAYEYDRSLPDQADSLLRSFTDYVTYLLSIITSASSPDNLGGSVDLTQTLTDRIEEHIRQGYYKQAVIEIMAIAPKKYRSPSSDEAYSILLALANYVEMLLPGLLGNFSWPSIHQDKPELTYSIRKLLAGGEHRELEIHLRRKSSAVQIGLCCAVEQRRQ